MMSDFNSTSRTIPPPGVEAPANKSLSGLSEIDAAARTAQIDLAALTEHSLTTNDPAAIEEYNALFEAKWEDAVRFEDAQFGTSP